MRMNNIIGHFNETYLSGECRNDLVKFSIRKLVKRSPRRGAGSPDVVARY